MGTVRGRSVGIDQSGLAYLWSVSNLIYSWTGATTPKVLTRPNEITETLFMTVTTVSSSSLTMHPGDYAARIFAHTAINTTTNAVTLATHGFENGDGPYKMTTSSTLPTGVGANDLWYVSVVDANTFKIHAKYGDAQDAKTGSEFDFTDQGTAGNHSLPAGLPATGSVVNDGYASWHYNLSVNSAGLHRIAISSPKKFTVALGTSTDVLYYWWY